MEHHRTQIGVDAQQLSEGQQSGLGLLVARRGIETGITDRAEQDGIRPVDGGPGFRGQRIPGGAHRSGTDQAVFQLKLEPEHLAGCGEDPQRRGDDLRPDSVARQDHDVPSAHASTRERRASRRRS